MKVSVELRLPDDFVLSCESMFVDIEEAIMCYVRSVKLLEATHDSGTTTEFKATQIFICFYLERCRQLMPDYNHANKKLILDTIKELRQLDVKSWLDCNASIYKEYMRLLVDEMEFSYAH